MDKTLKTVETKQVYTMNPKIQDQQQIVHQLNTQHITKKTLENIFVFAIDKTHEWLWIYTTMKITEIIKESGVFFKKTFTYAGYQIDHTVPINKQPIDSNQITRHQSYDVHRQNIHTLIQDIERRKLCWSDDKNDAIITMNNINHHLIKHNVGAVKVYTIYDLLCKLDPDVAQLYATGTLKEPLT